MGTDQQIALRTVWRHSTFYVPGIIAGRDGVFCPELSVAPLSSHFTTTLVLQHGARGLQRLCLSIVDA